MQPGQLVPLVECTRGPIMESLHLGAIAIVTPTGELFASAGDPGLVAFLRSSSKPFQALHFIERSGDRHFGLEAREVALLCASHAGTAEHVAVVRSIQAKCGFTEANLLCGVHTPGDDATAKALLLRGEAPTPNHHNCSGKHSGMLAAAQLDGFPLEDYINPQHPLQQIILQTFAEMVGMPSEQVILGTDGCSAPVFAVPLRQAALGFARLCDPANLVPERASACRRITTAMMAHPEMIAGRGKLDTVLMQALPGKLVAKGGAEGYQALGLMPSVLYPGSPALGITFKIADGDTTGRARACLAVALLQKVGAIHEPDLPRFRPFGPAPITNWRKLEVGELRPCFQLEWRHSPRL